MFTIGASSSRGLERTVNQDCLSTHPLQGGGLLAIIADGLGSYATSAEASALAAASVAAQIDAADRSGVLNQRALQAVIQHANQVLWTEALDRATVLRTTLTALLCLPGTTQTAMLAHVGDCRAYLVRDAQMRSLTRDHSRAAELGFVQQLIPAKWRREPSRHMLNRVLGEHPIVRVDAGFVELRDGDRLLLCSDGVWGSIDGEEFRLLMTKADENQPLVEHLIAAAQARGGTDDASAIVISVGGVAHAGVMPESANQREPATQTVELGHS